jgi:hypothetical protein
LLTEQGVRIKGASRTGAESKREQQKDRREPDQLRDQGRGRRENDHQPKLQQGSRLAERR